VGDRVIGRTAVAPPPPGRLASGVLEVRLPAPEGGGLVRVTVELEGSDVVPDDDRRTAYIDVAEEPAGIALVSFRPDWEPRFLAPALEQATGLPLRGFLRAGDGAYLRLGGAGEAGTRATEADARRAVERATQQDGLVVLHGVGEELPEWAAAALQRSSRLLVLAAPDASQPPLPLAVDGAVAGDFFPVRELSPSPVAPLLADLDPGAAVPLTALRTARPPAGAWSALMVSLARQAPPQPAVVGGQTGQRRWVVALGSGYWQWALRGGEERVLYNRLWGALAGWLVRDRGVAGPEPVRPARYALPRGVPVPWVAPGLAVDSLAVVLTAEDGAVAPDTVVAATAGDTAFTAAPRPGRYTFRARAFAGDTVIEGAGEFTVERYSPEFTRPPVELAALRAPAGTVREAAVRRGGTPLHATAWPYVLLVLLLAAEWVLRRRWGLR
jgi:hypothetical protein